MATADKKDTKTSVDGSKVVETTQQKNITITIPTPSFDLSSTETRFKFVLLGILFILLIASFFFFSRSNFATHEIFNFSRIQYNIEKLYSISFLLFITIFSLALAFGIYFGYGASKIQAIIGIVLIILVSIIAGMVSSPYFYAFMGFGSSVATTIAFASISKNISFSEAWGITNKALLLLLFFAFVGTFIKVSSNTNLYYNSLISGLAESAPNIISGVSPNIASIGQSELLACASAINSVNITEQTVSAGFPQTAFESQVQASAGPTYSGLPVADQQQISGALYQTCINFTVSSTNDLKNQMVTAITNYNVSNSTSSAALQNAVTPSLIEQTINSDPQLSNLKNYLPLVSGLAIASVVSLINIAVHILASVFLFILMKIIG